MGKTISMRMAKASEEDIGAAFELAGILYDLDRGFYPARQEDAEHSPTFFVPGDYDHLLSLYERLKKVIDRGSLFRVAGGLATLLNPENAIVDPDDDCIALHPRFKALEVPDGFARGALWKDNDGFARVQGVVEVAGVEWAVMRRWREDDDPKRPRRRRPFLFAVKSMQRGDDGWMFVPDSEAPSHDQP